jgi:hypothetical protein
MSKPSRRSLAATMAILLLGCSGGAQSDGRAGKVTVLLKDRPTAGVQAAVITIAEVDLVGASGPVVLTTTPVTTDLLTLANDVAKLVDGASVPAGTYTQLRFVITGGYLDVDGTIYASSPDYAGLPPGAVVGGTLRMPSFGQSGLKVLLPSAIEIGGEARFLVVDFDVSQSFGHAAGGSGAWVMHPVVKATELAMLGGLRVTLALAPGATLPAGVALTDFSAVVTPAGGGDATVVGLADLGGGTIGAAYPYLFPGDYAVDFEAPAAVTAFTTDPAVPATVTVIGGQDVFAAFLLQAPATGGEPEPPPNPL